MISTLILGLALVPLLVVRPSPVHAVTLAECQAWLCLPAGFSTQGGSPTTACDPAQQAVLRRLRLHMDPLPPWAHCAAQFGWDTAALTWTFPTKESCRPGDHVTAAGVCQGTDANGCTVTYTPREHGYVWVWVDGVKTGASLPYTLTTAGAPNTDLDSCRRPPPPMNDDANNDGGPALNVGIHGDAAGEAGDAGGAGGLGGLGGLGGGVGGLN